MAIPIGLTNGFLYDRNIFNIIKKFNTFQTLESALSVMNEYNHVPIVKKLINSGANNLHNNLYFACKNGQLDVVSLILSKGIITSCNSFEVSCENEHIEVVKFLLLHPIEDLQFCIDDTLQTVCKNGNKELIKLIIDKGVKNFGKGLYGAIIGGHKDIINMMIEKNPNTSRVGEEKHFFDWGLEGACQVGDNPLIDFMIKNGGYELFGFIGACRGQKMDIAQNMLDKHKIINEIQYDHIFNRVCFIGHYEYIKLFVDHFEKMNYYYFSYDSALVAACHTQNMDLIMLMLKLGADVDQEHFNAACGGDQDIIELIMNEAIKRNVELDLDVGLEIASMLGNINAAEFLIGQGASDLDGALLIACNEHNIDFVEFIITEMKYDDDVDIDILNMGLHNACVNDDICIAKYLIKSGASLNMDDINECFTQNVMPVIKLLIPQLPKQTQLLLFNEACENRHVEIVEFFLKHNPDFESPRFMSLRSCKKQKL